MIPVQVSMWFKGLTKLNETAEYQNNRVIPGLIIT